MSYVEGPGLTRAYDNKPAQFTVHALDDTGNPVDGDTCEVTVKPEDPASDLKSVPVTIKDNGDGTYTCDYEPTQAGKFVITVSLDGDAVKGTPKNIRIREGVDSNKLGRATFTATIAARNKDGELKSEGGDEWVVTIVSLSDSSEVPNKAKDHGNGTYSVEYKLDAPSGDDHPQEFSLSMTLNGDHIPGSPFKQFM